MHNAPPVAFPVGRTFWGRVVGLILVLSSACALLAVMGYGQVKPASLLVAGFAWALCVGVGWFWAPRENLSAGRLFWSGEAWFWQADAPATEMADSEQNLHLSVGLDLGWALLLWVTPLDAQGHRNGRLCSVWAQEASMPMKWHGFRCAVYSLPVSAPNDSGLRV
jgi:hypothetical protein